MKISKTCIAVLLFATCVAGQLGPVSPLNYTRGFINGRAWRDWSKDMRLGFLIGYGEGLDIGIAGGYTLGAPGRQDGYSASVSMKASLYPPDGVTYGEKLRAVDRFYDDPLNDQIPIYTCLMIVSKQFKGYDPKLIDEQIREARKAAQEGAKEQKLP